MLDTLKQIQSMRICNEIISNINVKNISNEKLFRVYVENKEKYWANSFLVCVILVLIKKKIPEGGNQEQ